MCLKEIGLYVYVSHSRFVVNIIGGGDMDDHLMSRINDHLMKTNTMFIRFRKARGNGYNHGGISNFKSRT